MNNKKLRVSAGFVFLNFAVSFLLGLQYFAYVGGRPLEIAFAAAAYLSNLFMIYLVLSAAALLISAVARPPAVSKYLLAALFFAVNLLVFIDVEIYRIFRFHINGLVLNTIFTRGGWESLEFNTATEIFLFLIIIFAASLELLMYEYVDKYFDNARRRIGKSVVILCAVFVLATVAADKGMFAYGDLYGMPGITRYIKLFPLYQPLTVKRFAQKHFNIKKQETVKFKFDSKNTGLLYPKNPLRFEKIGKGRLPNIIIILSDSVRYDMMTPAITPNIYKFSRDALYFKNHYSGGNCTRFGVFSIFYGLYGYYWNTMLGERRSPVLMDTLSRLGYDFRILASAELTFPEFDKTCFVNVEPSAMLDNPAGKTKSDKDAIVTDELIKYIDGRKGDRPFFAFLFLDCPHGSYDSPPGFEKFKPTVTTFNYLTLSKDNILPVFNRYKNSVYYNDYLIGKIIDDLKKRRELNNTVLIISADHGEAFFERGFYGHNRGFCEEEIHVPFVFYLPGAAPKQFEKFTSHLDIVPTLMSLVGCKNDCSDFSEGMPLMSGKRRDFVVSSTWDELAVVDDRKFTAVVPVETYKISGIKLYDPDCREVTDKKAMIPFNSYLTKLQMYGSAFLK